MSAPFGPHPYPWRSAQTEPEPTQPSLTSRLPEIALGAAWKHRWRLAPASVAAGAAIGAAAAPGWTVTGLAAAAAAMEAAARTGIKGPRGRMFLSRRERRIASSGLAATAAWTAQCGLTAGMLPWWAEAAILGAALGYPTRAWWTSRRPAPPPPSLLSPLAERVLNGWVQEITVGSGPRALRGSWPVEGSLIEPAEGALGLTVQLAHGVHAADAASGMTRRGVEALLGMPVDTVSIEAVRDNSTQVQIMFTPSRHLERPGGVDWQGPVLLDNGLMPLAERLDGSTVEIPLFDSDGVRHGFISGTSGSGKSVSSVSVLLPGLKAGVVVALLADGKKGISTPYLRSVVSRYARMPEQWPILIEIAYQVMVARMDRRGALGLNEWHTWDEDDPIVMLMLDDVTAINRVLSSKHVGMVCEILEQGRAVGVEVWQITQSPSFEDIIGGVQARNLMTSAGSAICHRAGGSGASRLTLDSASGVDVDLRGLPDGQAAVLVRGKLVGFPAQVRHARKDLVMEVLPTITQRHLAGADLAAAGPAYTAAHWDDCWTPGYTFDPHRQSASLSQPAPQTSAALVGLTMAHEWVLTLLSDRGPMKFAQLQEVLPAADGLEQVLADLSSRRLLRVSDDGTYSVRPSAAPTMPAPRPSSGAEDVEDDLPASRRWVLDRLRRHGPQQLKELETLAEQDTHGPSRKTISNALTDLSKRGQVIKTGALWAIAETAGLDPIGDEPAA
ncbi:MAG TPA: hypothetical protein VFP72_13735 [Kineosporiaceae bacterium]|nr:hypothetical protein [Kineosporiaceae bacterium]